MVQATSAGVFGSLYELQHRTYAIGPGRILYWAPEGGPTGGINYQSWARDGSTCQTSGGSVGLPMLLASTLLNMDDLATPPLTLKANPVIFHDGFETGDPDRWDLP